MHLLLWFVSRIPVCTYSLQRIELRIELAYYEHVTIDALSVSNILRGKQSL